MPTIHRIGTISRYGKLIREHAETGTRLYERKFRNLTELTSTDTNLNGYKHLIITPKKTTVENLQTGDITVIEKSIEDNKKVYSITRTKPDGSKEHLYINATEGGDTFVQHQEYLPGASLKDPDFIARVHGDKATVTLEGDTKDLGNGVILEKSDNLYSIDKENNLIPESTFNKLDVYTATELLQNMVKMARHNYFVK